PTTKVSIQPPLGREYPTYGKLLQSAGYQTPYIGKWHLSVPGANDTLEAYGFHDMTLPDPTGSNLQGTIGDPKDGYLSDGDIADQAAAWLQQRQPIDSPWCLTVGFVCLTRATSHAAPAQAKNRVSASRLHVLSK